MGCMRSLSRRALILFLLTLPGCAAHQAGLTTTGGEGSSQALIRVYNDGARSVSIHLVASGMEILLGTVGAMESRQFRVTDAHLGLSSSHSLMAREHGETHARESIPFQLRVGAMISWRLSSGPSGDLDLIDRR